MKKINNLMFVSLLMAFAFSVMSCNKDKDDDVDLSKAIVGIWDFKNSETFVDGKTELDFFIEVYSNYEGDLNGDGIIDKQDEFNVNAFKESYGSNNNPVEAYIEFKADGNGKSYDRYKDGDEDNFNFKYEISGNKLILTYEDNENYEGDEDEDVEEWVFSIKGNTLTLTLEDEWEFYVDRKKHTRRHITTLTKR